jgi:hypothetical protein
MLARQNSLAPTVLSVVSVVAFFAFDLVLSHGGQNHVGSAALSLSQPDVPQESASRTQVISPRMIEPGIGVGSLKLGDSQSHALELFPRKAHVDQESLAPGCGIAYLWVDLQDPNRGTVTIRFSQGLVVQIDSASSLYRTDKGITSLSSPGDVKRSYEGLKAYALMNNFSEALGGRPMIFWVDEKKGVAFGFASERRNHKRYVYEIDIFKSGSNFCPQGSIAASPDWRELAPYSIELPDQTARFAVPPFQDPSRVAHP